MNFKKNLLIQISAKINKILLKTFKNLKLFNL